MVHDTFKNCPCYSLMELGELSGYKFGRLQESMKKQSLLYLSNYNISRLDELRIFLEYDGWELCPVKPDFVATELQEFKSLKPILNKSKVCNGLDTSITNEIETPVGIELLLQKYLEYGTSPFTVGLDDTMEEDILAHNEVCKIRIYFSINISIEYYDNYNIV